MTVAERVATEGFAVLPRYCPEESGRAAFARLGVLLALPDFADVQVLKPQRSETSTPNTYSGNFGYDVFPLHTDLAHWASPPRHVALRCVHGMSDVATLVVDGNDVVAKIGALSMRRALAHPRRPLRGARALLRLRECPAGKTPLLRWDSIFLRPATPSSRETFQAVDAYLRSVTAQHIVLSDVGDTLILDNWRMLHGRAAVPMRSHARRIERAYLGGLR